LALRPQSPQTPGALPASRQSQGDVFLREVDEAVRQDEMASFAKRFGLAILVAVLAGLLGLAGFLWWQHHSREQIDQRGEELVQALDHVEAGQLDAADQQLAPIATADDAGSGAAAKLLRADITEQQGRSAEAAKLFAAVAADNNAPKPFRDLATVREVAAGFDALPPRQVVDRLKPLAVPGNAWFGSAGEMLGIAYLKLGQRELAGPLFASIARDEATPQSLRRRARQLAGLLGVDAIDDVARAASEEGGGMGSQ
jgi:hypothetical protein